MRSWGVADGAPILTVIGCAPAWGNPGEPCSSYLVEAVGTRILLDCGSGAFAALWALDPRPLDAVVLSHMHHDHVADLIPFGYARRYAGLAGWPAPRLLAPPGGLARLEALALAGGGQRDHLDGPFVLSEYEPGTPSVIGDVRLTFAPQRHPGVSHAIRLEAGGYTDVLGCSARCDAGARRTRERRRRPALRGDVCRRRRLGRRAPQRRRRRARGDRGGRSSARARPRRRRQAAGRGRRSAGRPSRVPVDAAVAGYTQRA